ncbi:hypothetical protein L6258_00160 [Candidatus Parcubacteria bacterium]|nr:hypothetical protein [Candidatus Parcubacteria bacterium]
MQTVKASTQSHLDIEDVKDDLVVTKSGGAALVIETNAVNFDLLSEKEQDAMIQAFGSLLNSLSFPIQIVVRSKRIDISEYLEMLRELESKESDPKLQGRITSYHNFIQELIIKNEILDKNFYIIIPFREVTLTPRGGPFNWLSQLLGKPEKRVRIDIPQVLQRARIQIEPKKEHLIKELARVGIKARVLRTRELVGLFFDLYNAGTAHEQRPKIEPSDYSSPIVEPLVEGSEVKGQ